MAKDVKNLRIEGDVAIWPMREEGKIKGTYVGTFKFRCYLTPMQQIAQNREYRELLGNSSPTLADEHTSFMAYALSQLKQRVIEAPPFWSENKHVSGMDGDIPDEEIVEAVLNAAITAEVNYKKALADSKEKSIKRAEKGAEAIEKEQEDQDDSEAEESDS